MDSLIVSLNVSIPIFIMLGVGYLLKRLGFVSKEFIADAGQLNFRVFLSCSIFNNLFQSDLQIGSHAGTMLMAAVLYLGACFAALLAVRPVTKDRMQRATLATCIFRTNYSYIGLPTVATICGEEGSAVAALVLAVMVCIGNVMSVAIYSTAAGDHVDFRKIIRGIIRNPNIIALALGLVFMLTGLGHKVPMFLTRSLKSLASVSTPLALFALGASFEFGRLKTNRKMIIEGNILSLVVFPAAAGVLSILCGFRGAALCALFILIACPAATVNFPMAQAMGGDSEIASQQIVTQSAMSVFTLFVFVFILKSLGMV